MSLLPKAKAKKSNLPTISASSSPIMDECKTTNGDSIGCAYCVRYKNYIDTLHTLLNDNGILWAPLKNTKQGDKIVPDTMPQLDLSEERLDHLINEHYTEETFGRGTKGLVEFIHDYIIHDDDTGKLVYACPDPARKIFHYYDDDGLQKDTRCKNLMDVLYNPLIKKVNKIYKILINRIYQEEESEESSSDSESEDDYDEDIENIMAEEIHVSLGKKKEDTSIIVIGTKTIDERVDNTVSIFLEIKKVLGKVRKPVIDDLVTLLS